ncbi:DUF3383 domain-containing protein, partial [Patescibacteria group bacterium]|nr:DUF3383 domain-containing protein [Patescibacteria group bacterium]
MDLGNIISVTATLQNPAINRYAFGEPAIYGNTDAAAITVDPTIRAKRYATSTALVDLAADGFATTHPIYLAAQILISQSPRPQTFKVLFGLADYTHAVELTAISTTEGVVNTVTITKDGTARSYTYTNGAGESLNTIATALQVLMNADVSGWGVAGSAELTIASAANPITIDAVSPANDNEMWYYSALSNQSIVDVSTERGGAGALATELTAILAYDADWYELIPADAFGAVELALISTWVNSATLKYCSLATQDSPVVNAGTGIAATLAGANSTKTTIIYSANSMAQYPNAASSGRFLPLNPGTYQRAFKSLTGVTSSNLTSAQITNAFGDFCNLYTGVELGGVTIVSGDLQRGYCSATAESYADTYRLI